MTISRVLLTLLLISVLTAGFNIQRVSIVASGLAGETLTSKEVEVTSLVNGSEAYSFDLHLENIGLAHPAFRAAGSVGANETADWIANQFESFGLEVEKEAYQFTNWDLQSKPALIIDEDGNLTTSGDQTVIKSFQCQHCSLPANVFSSLVVLPLPVDPTIPIGHLWDAIDTTGKVVLTGYRIRSYWEATFKNKLATQTPAAVIYTPWYNSLSFVPDSFASTGGRPAGYNGHYYWDFGIPVGSVNYEDGEFIKDIVRIAPNVSAKVVIDSVVGNGPNYNVVGKFRGYEEPDKLVIISGHYDTVMCAGFCDNGAGESAVIELARVFTEAVRRGLYYPKYSFLFVALTGEEMGLVGSINYIAGHKAEMENVIAVLNLDCIGSDTLLVTKTDPDHGIDLDQIVLKAAVDLGVGAQLSDPGSSDEWPFADPEAGGDDVLMFWWGTSLGIGDAHPVRSSATFESTPLFYYDSPSGWIHTSNDNSTSTETLSWVEVEDLENQIRVAALTLMRVNPTYKYPVAVLTYEPQVSWVNETVVFSATQSYSPSGNITGYTWCFADKNVSTTEPAMNYTFGEQGNYNVTLEIIDETLLKDSVSIMVLVTYRADVNKDKTVNILDISILAAAYNTRPGDEKWNANADLDNNEWINILDISAVAKDYGKTV